MSIYLSWPMVLISFRIKNIPTPRGLLSNGQSGSVRMNKRNLTVSSIKADFPDFIYDLPATVAKFDITVQGQTRSVTGSRLDSGAKALVNNAPRNTIVVIDNIKVRTRAKTTIKDASPIIIQLAN